MSALRKGAVGLLLAALAALGGWIGWSALLVDHRRPLPPAIEAERRTVLGRRAGWLSYYLDRSAPGRPLVLIHSVNAAASAYELRPIFQAYRSQRPVYALDLPGFGFSERSDRTYSPRLYADAILDLVEDELSGAEPVDLVALSLGSEFAARAALERPDRVRSLALISPTGFGSERRGGSPIAARLLGFPLWSQAFYDLLVTRPSIEYFLRLSFVGPVDRDLVEYALATSHQPGARYAPIAFVSGQLFTPDIREAVYEQLAQPVLVLYDQDAFVRFDRLPEVLERHPNWSAVRIAPTRGLPHFERPADTIQALDAFWQRIG